MASKAERRARKRAARRITLAGGAQIDQRPTGRDRTHTNQPEDARRTALEARCRIVGQSATKDALRASTAPLRGCAVGLCIEALHQEPETQARLWDTWQAMSIARRAWRLRNLGQSGDPQAAAIAMLPDAMQADPSLRVDMRTAAERDRDAKRAADEWDAAINSLPWPQLKAALRHALDGFPVEVWRDAAPTGNGRNVVRALEILSEARNG